MKKFFTMMLALVAVVAVNATKVVFDFTNPAELGVDLPDPGNGTSVSGKDFVIDGVTMSNVKVASTDNRVWNANGVYDLRIYTKSTITFTAEDDITAIEFDGKNIKFSEISGKAWVGEETSVTFTATGTCNINKITVTVGEPADVWTPDVVTVSQAVALAKNSDAHDHYVTGVVKNQPFITYSTFKDKVSFWMYDAENPNDTIEFYDGLGKNGAKWESLEEAWNELRIGDTIKVYASKLAMYTPKESNIPFAEITGGHYVEKLGANPNPPEIIIPVVELDTITVAEALNLAKALTPEAGKSAYTDKEYVVGGFVVGISAKYEKTYYMADEEGVKGEFQAFKCETIDADVAVGDYVFVRGKIQNYNGTSYNNYEIAYGALVHGEAPEQPEIEPITIAAAIEIAAALQPEKGSSLSTEDNYAVKGFIVKVKDAEKKTYYMADEQGAYGDFQAYRCASIDYEVAEGDEVIVTGKIMHYWGEGSSGEYHNYEISGGKLKHLVPQGIENVTLTDKAHKVMIDGVMYIVRDGKMFDVRGAQVR